ncbi:unnamed protein product [Euphydryas editha]|uniref:Trichohyalin-plectin-homology domain-containing protein n=1 Tax=Euphydryas editha TaxID=104508 RepID=A0AAU9U5M8_EUPED|nr:unnamed protein product [Euphydryas editha]
MSRPSYLVLQKTEWDRIKRGPSPKKIASDKNDYINSLIEQSQNWIKTWPDTVKGHVYQLEKQKEIKHAQDLETVKKFLSTKKKESKMESIKKAKEMIFEDSCYGRQLLSALLESKTLEEREQQVLFQKKIKHEAELREQNESKSLSLQNAREMELNEIKMKKLKKEHDLDVARINQALAKHRKESKINEREKEKSEAIKFDLLEKELLEQELKIQISKVNSEKQQINEFEAYRKQIQNLRKQREESDERRREIFRKYKEKIKNKEKNIIDEIHKNKTNTLHKQHVYKIIKDINDEKIKQYNEFIDNGVKSILNREKILEKAEAEKKYIEHNKRKSLDEENKTLAKLQHRFNSQENPKYVCCRQSIIGKSCYKAKNSCDKSDQPHLSKKISLLDDLKKREKEPSPWSSLKAKHTQFAQHANDILKQCRFKQMAWKVIEDYRRINCLDPESLPIKDN